LWENNWYSASTPWSQLLNKWKIHWWMISKTFSNIGFAHFLLNSTLLVLWNFKLRIKKLFFTKSKLVNFVYWNWLEFWITN
jgi:hypothetical protein